jgi:hypothetical protein
MYDLVGDIHGQARELEALLDVLGYHLRNGVFHHPDRRQVIFLGDFIDRGPEQRRVVDLARAMTENGSALAVMGNHEYNAIAYFTPKVDGSYLRERSVKNTGQHRDFLDAYEETPTLWAETINWFKTLPLWLDLDDLRVVHACWDREYINRILQYQEGSNLLGDELLKASADSRTWQHTAIETLLKGKEIPLPEGDHFFDQDGNKRHDIRVSWWDSANTYQKAFLGPESARTDIPDDPIDGDHLIDYGEDEKPVFLGHYWLKGKPARLAKNIACLDYSVANPGGKLVAYRWDRKGAIDPFKFVAVERFT